MSLKFFSSTFLSRLHRGATENLGSYGSECGWIESFAGPQPYIFESKVLVDPAPQLVVSAEDNAKNDAMNAIHVFSWLKALTPALAMEERLWSYLTHVVFPEYMHARWPAESEGVVHRRYLFEGQSFGALARNGISRLWWAGYLTHDSNRSNPFELTEILFFRQDIQVSLLERSLGKCERVRTVVLEFLRDNRAWLSEAKFGKRIQVLLRELNLLGGVAVLDSLPASAIQAYLRTVGSQLTRSE